MEPVSFLQSYTELAIAVVGFSGIVLAIQDGNDGSSTFKKINMSMLIWFGGSGIVWAILPQILISLNLPDDAVWRLASAVFVMVSIAFGFIRRIHSARVGVDFGNEIGNAFKLLMSLQILLLLANVYVGAFWLYAVVLTLFLLVGIILFSKLLGLDKVGF